MENINTENNQLYGSKMTCKDRNKIKENVKIKIRIGRVHESM